MSSSHHDDHYLQEQKPIAFTVPFILASVLIIIILMFLSLCDPKPHHSHEAMHEGHMAPAATEASHHSDAAMEEHHQAPAEAVAPVKDSDSAQSAPVTEPAEPAHEQHH